MNPEITLRTPTCTIRFSRCTGALLGIENPDLGDQVLKDGPDGPFRLHADLDGEFLLDTDPESAAKVHVSPREMVVVSARTRRSRGAQRVSLVSRGSGFECTLEVALLEDRGESEWRLTVTNTGEVRRGVMVDFPHLAGVHPGPADAPLRATRLNQAGGTEEAWASSGGIYGNSSCWPMAWHAIYDPVTRSALGVMVEDPDLLNKRLVLNRPSLAVRWFPPRDLAPGESLTLPPVRMLIGTNGWQQTARAYARWYARAFHPVRPPRWAAASDALDGRHLKKLLPGGKPDYGIQFALDSFRDLPGAHLRLPFDNTEYAFWSRGSMLYGKHTDGDNVVREDLGGWTAMREGIAGLHRLGLHATLYIEGYIVPVESELARAGKAQRWSVMHRDGSITGGYTAHGFHHMCPGCVEWQDHLASVVRRVLTQTGADGVRLDSLGFYYLPCYNPEHHHETPFGYNQWVARLLEKVRQAALAVNPRALLTTEAPVDFYGRCFHGALTQWYPEDLPPMRLAIGPYRPFVYSPGGPVWGSISGLSGGRSCDKGEIESAEANWICARTAVHDTLVWGDVADQDPCCSDPGVATRRFTGRRCEVVVAARRKVVDGTWQVPDPGPVYEVDLPSAAPLIALCDLKRLTWCAVRPESRAGQAVLSTDASWAMAVLPRGEERVVAFDAMPEVTPGGEVTIRAETLVGPAAPVAIAVRAPGLRVVPARARTDEPVRLRVPSDALPGWYSVRVTGRYVLGIRRLLHVVA